MSSTKVINKLKVAKDDSRDTIPAMEAAQKEKYSDIDIIDEVEVDLHMEEKDRRISKLVDNLRCFVPSDRSLVSLATYVDMLIQKESRLAYNRAKAEMNEAWVNRQVSTKKYKNRELKSLRDSLRSLERQVVTMIEE